MPSQNQQTEIHCDAFGSCCDDMKHCMKQSNCLFHISENGSFFMTIGYVQTNEGTGWFDHAVIFCPFCGKKLQDKKKLADKVKVK